MKREKNNIFNIVFCLLALLPILLVLVNYNSEQTFASNLNFLEGSLSSLTSIPFLNQIRSIVIFKLFEGNTNVYLLLSVDYFSYLFVLSVVDLCYYAVLFFFRIIKDLIDKLGGNI